MGGMTLNNTYIFYFRGMCGSFEGGQVSQHSHPRKSVGRIGNLVQLSKNGNHQGGYRLQIMGHRKTMLPNYYDANGADQTGRVYGLPKKVNVQKQTSPKVGLEK